MQQGLGRRGKLAILWTAYTSFPILAFALEGSEKTTGVIS
jgi:hypothetical protein